MAFVELLQEKLGEHTPNEVYPILHHFFLD